MNELIKLKVKTKTTPVDNQVLETKFIEACTSLDASIFEPLIEEEQYFEDLDKYRFLEKLKNELNEVRSKGINEVKLVQGHCKGCELGHLSHEFHSENGFEFSYMIIKDKGEVSDIYQCYLSSGYWDKLDEYESKAHPPKYSNDEMYEILKEENPTIQSLKDKFDLDI